MRLHPALLIAATAALALGACGKRGALERPPPLWGKEKAQDAQQQSTTDTDAQKAKDAQPVRSNQDRPVPPQTLNLPAASAPLETGQSDPVGSSPVAPH
jgi:predicted small lipoprotein YifL